jgi:hypothetical protein
MELLGWVIGASLRNQSVFVPYVLVHVVFIFIMVLACGHFVVSERAQ